MATIRLTITSRENRYIKEASKLLASRRFREQQGLFLVEGARLCQDAAQSGIRPLRLFTTPQGRERYPEILAQLELLTSESYDITPELAKKLSDTAAPQGIFAVCPIPQSSFSGFRAGGRYLLLNSLQDPGNIGAILRTAEAFALDGVLLSKDCPDLYSSKVLRAAMGGVFRVKAQVVLDVSAAIDGMRAQGILVYAAALHRNALPITQAPLKEGGAVIIGNEGSGLPEDLIEKCTAAVIIPMEGRAESLNAAVAAAIIAWEMRRGESVLENASTSNRV